mmetsp:Transcript_19331/g.32512  ORF Transcript_19331/g.32512 Transcript_19331/m.32512 type:complete len:757 (-) Transcript_19331:570-2840(-)|eukprot:CAMPEP_0114413064 /NCGR_PEP_ID=MMETSP0103-20121206/658_1 /TAXON_ID=37642 ORGANISM="Paraphysomonas imperforata, Strain PA2" /NCGR_SAMPLE_ID=MMETSP0103 /ASSEMBLY_ACC=CAM_ASM_000201 /LENGTH=756 /DNA_ID=CAMNT_0001581119 /DNA_START=43 /DNA_END=2313 /DNA_ORIENTATION=-
MTRITVGVRIKPENDDTVMKYFNHINTAQGGGVIEMNANGTKHEFNFDYIFDMKAQQCDVFETCAISVINSVMDGYNGTLFAYGQTGAGKTHTVMGPTVETYEERGLCLRTIDYIFKTVRESSINRSYIIKLSVIEIYNDIVIDLLREEKVNGNSPGDMKKQPPPKLIIMDTPDGVVIPALYLFPIDSEDEAYVKITEANLNRAVAEHQLNRRSSRSHAIYTFYVTQSPAESTVTDGSDVEQSKLHLVDLAGSERIEKTGSTGGLIKEATHINKSLSFLEQVVLALTKQAASGPAGGGGGTAASAGVVASYRQSKLTYILKDSLGGNCNTLLIGCIWPHKHHVWETLSTLRFATRMKCIENHPKRNALVTGGSSSSTRALQNTIESLKRELMMRDAIHSYSRQGLLQAATLKPDGMNIATDNRPAGVYTETLTLNQQTVSVNMACEYGGRGSLDLNLPDILSDRELELKSLSQAQAVAASLRCALWHACGGDETAVQTALTKMKDSFAGHNLHPGSHAHYTPKKPMPCHEDPPVVHDTSTIEDMSGEGGAVNSGAGIKQFQPLNLLNQQVDPVVVTNSPTLQREPEPGSELEPVPERQQQLSMQQSQPSPSPSKTEMTPQDSLDPFELFKTTEGLHHHNNYEEAKQSLKELKQLQKSLVIAVNAAKAKIDATSERINELNSETIATLRESSEKEIADLKVTLAESKSIYRQERGKLLKVKEDLAAGTLQKQQLLKDLVAAYEEYRVSVGFGEQEEA